MERLASGQRKKHLDVGLMDDLRDRFESRILPVATATVHDLTLVTRDTSDFEIALESILNPWSD